jgi:hypothetical protein
MCRICFMVCEYNSFRGLQVFMSSELPLDICESVYRITSASVGIIY